MIEKVTKTPATMKITLIIFFFIPTLTLAQDNVDEILSKSVDYHDPDLRWPSLNTTLHFQESRPDGGDRTTVIVLNNTEGFMKINRNDQEIYEIENDKASVLKGEGDADRGMMLRNYYLYLWGLPMKLYDESTPGISLVEDELVDDTSAKVLRVAYDKDTWYFYLDPLTGRLLQYKFYQDQAETKGELITLEDEISVHGIKIPQKRSWYTLPDMKYLGTDRLVSAE